MPMRRGKISHLSLTLSSFNVTTQVMKTPIASLRCERDTIALSNVPAGGIAAAAGDILLAVGIVAGSLGEDLDSGILAARAVAAVAGQSYRSNLLRT